jgi:hypothetical protein
MVEFRIGTAEIGEKFSHIFILLFFFAAKRISRILRPVFPIVYKTLRGYIPIWKIGSFINRLAKILSSAMNVSLFMN